MNEYIASSPSMNDQWSGKMWSSSCLPFEIRSWSSAQRNGRMSRDCRRALCIESPAPLIFGVPATANDGPGRRSGSPGLESLALRRDRRRRILGGCVPRPEDAETFARRPGHERGSGHDGSDAGAPAEEERADCAGSAQHLGRLEEALRLSLVVVP